MAFSYGKKCHGKLAKLKFDVLSQVLIPEDKIELKVNNFMFAYFLLQNYILFTGLEYSFRYLVQIFSCVVDMFQLEKKMNQSNHC